MQCGNAAGGNGAIKKKEMIILGSILAGLGTLFNLFFTAALHRMLSGQMETLVLVPIGECVSGLFAQQRQGMLFLSFECFTALCCILFFTQNSRAYQSDLMKVTDEIEIPVPAGQFQHGSSKWMREEEKDRIFEVCMLDPADPVIRELIGTGYEGLGFMQDAGKVDTGAAGGQEDRMLSGGAVPAGYPAENSGTAGSCGIRRMDMQAYPPGAPSAGIDQAAEQETEPGKEGQGKQEDRGEQQNQGKQEKREKQENQGKQGKQEDKEQEDRETDEGYETVDYAWQEPEQEPDASAGEERRTTGESDPCRILKAGGIVIGMSRRGKKEKIHYIADDTHTLTIGATRSGKTRTLVLQSICLMALAGESLVISDPKAELYQYTAPFLGKLGYDVICLDFKNPEKSSRYNLLQPIIDAVNRGETDKAEMYAWDITNILVGDNSSNEKIWENGEKSTIAAAILCVVVDNARRPEYQNLTNVYWFVAEMCKAVGNRTPMQEYVKKLRPGHPARALLSISDVAPSRTKGSFYTSALTTLRLFTSRAVYSITHKSDCQIADIGRRKQALFFILPDEKTTYYPIASLMVSQLYELLVHQSDERGGRLVNRVNFVLEEFGNFTKINDLTNKLTVAGGRGMRFHFFLQSFEQLTEKYNRETAAIVKSNCQSWVYLQADDKETLSEICDKLGKYTCSGYQLSSQHGKYVNPSSSSTVSLVGRELLTADEIRRVSRPYQIVVSRSHPAMMVSPDLSQWYFNRMLGLGDKEHNRKVREERERRRPVLTSTAAEIPLWNIWVYYTKDLQMKEEKQRQQGISAQAGSLFSEKFMRRGGKTPDNEEDE